jgi:predicted transcriptional regulator
MQTSVLLSIKPKFAEKIFDGEKRFEFRRRVFANKNVKKIVVYVSAPISKVVGEFEIEDIIELEIENLWDHTKEHSGIAKDYFDSYFDGLETGFAIKIGKTCKYDAPLKLDEDFNVKHAPQSFIYLESEDT